MEPENQELDPPSKLEELTDTVKSYINTVYELNKLKFIDKLSSVLAGLTVGITLVIFSLLVILLASIGASLWINELLNSAFSGFFIVAGFYAVIGLLVLLTKESLIKKPVASCIIKNTLDHSSADIN